jgi:DNA-directed RNA polymerase subunit M/transcription elongation factor TFIIS
MKILKKVKPVEKEVKKTCGKCKTKFSYTQSDTETDRDGKFVKCPTCKAFIAVK